MYIIHEIYALLLYMLCVLQEELSSGEDVAKCPSCSLMIKVIYDIVSSLT